MHVVSRLSRDYLTIARHCIAFTRTLADVNAAYYETQKAEQEELYFWEEEEGEAELTET